MTSQAFQPGDFGGEAFKPGLIKRDLAKRFQLTVKLIHLPGQPLPAPPDFEHLGTKALLSQLQLDPTLIPLPQPVGFGFQGCPLFLKPGQLLAAFAAVGFRNRQFGRQMLLNLRQFGPERTAAPLANRVRPDPVDRLQLFYQLRRGLLVGCQRRFLICPEAAGLLEPAVNTSNQVRQISGEFGLLPVQAFLFDLKPGDRPVDPV